MASEGRRRVLALFSKAPLPGQVKTRLVPPLSFEQAAELAEAMLRDVLALHAADPPGDLALWYAPPDARAWFRDMAPSTYRLLAQEGPDLGSRMAHLFRLHAGEGYDRIVLRGTDSPTLPAARISQAFDALDANDLVLCPDRDGGYNLIGLCAPSDPLFEIEMSLPSVLDATVARADALGLRTALLPPHHDVDTAADLALLDDEASAESTPHTRRWLDRRTPAADPDP